MKPYELTYIISSQTASENAESVKKEVEFFIQDKGGVIVKSEKSVPEILAYPVKRQSSGYFIVLEFQMSEPAIKEVKAMLQKNASVLRHFIIVKKAVKQRKERKMRREKAHLLTKAAKEKSEEKPKGFFTGKTVSEAKVQAEDIEKKLDEILSE